MRPPWCSTISRQIGNPSPVPRGLSVSVSPAWPNCSKTFSWSSWAIPTPVSVTLTTISAGAPSDPPPVVSAPGVASRAAHVMEPDGVNLTAFEMRLITTWIRRSRSPTTGGRSSATAITMLGPSRSRRDDVAATARPMTSPTATLSRRHSIRPASILARSRVSLISAVSRSPSSTMIPRFSEI